MARYAMVYRLGGFVANVIEWDGDETKWQPPADYDMIEDAAGKASPGFRYDRDTGEFLPPPSGQPVTGA